MLNKDIVKLYIQCDYKDKNERSGIIYNRPKKGQKIIYMSFIATKDDNFVDLHLHQTGKDDIDYHLEKDFEINFTLKSILYFVENRIEIITK